IVLFPKKVTPPPRMVAAAARPQRTEIVVVVLGRRRSLLGQDLVAKRIADTVARQTTPAHTREMRGGERDYLVDDQFPDLLDGRPAGVVVDVVHEVPVVVVQLRLGVHEVTQEQPLLSSRLQQKDGGAGGVPTRLKRADAREKALLPLEELHA